MATGSHKGNPPEPAEKQGGGQSAGIPAAGQVEGNSVSTLGNPGVRHWQSGYITKPGLEDRGNIFFAAVEMTRMPMVVTDPNQTDNPIVFANGAFLDLTEYQEHQVIGRNCRFLQGEDTSRQTVAEVREALQQQRAVAVDILNYKASGKAFWNALFIGPVFDEHGKLLYFFASQMDITRRRVSEQAFLQAQKMEAIGQLTAGLAHDFNNLLQVASGNQEIALNLVSDNNQATRAIKQAQSAIIKASKLTQQLLTFARKQRLEPRRVNLNTLVVDFSEMLVRTLGDKVDLLLELKPGVPSCELDPTQMEMALLNVLINARDAMPNGGKVTISTSILKDKDRIDSHRLMPGTYVLLCVSDEGEGMSADVLRRATEPFFTTKGPGTGLGLAMAHGFVQQSQGRLEIDSVPGQGTTIRMIFPIANASGLEIFNERREERKLANEPAWNVKAILDRKTILVVDDSQDIRELAENYLRSLGYRVLAAQSGEDAMALLERYGEVDLLFTDIIMPGGMNGLQLVEKVRERQPDLPVLLATGYMEDLPGHSLSGPMTILSKPFQLAELRERVGTALSNKGQRSEHHSRQTANDFRHEG